MNENKQLNIGFGNYILVSRIVSIVSPNSSPMRRLREEAQKRGQLVDATHGRKTRSIVVTDCNQVYLSALQTETLAERLRTGKGKANG